LIIRQDSSKQDILSFLFHSTIPKWAPPEIRDTMNSFKFQIPRLFFKHDDSSMKRILSGLGLLAVLLFFSTGALADEPLIKPPVTPDELQARDQWVQENLGDAKHKMPFSFTYGGQASDGILPGWSGGTTTQRLDANRTQRDFTWSDLQTGLEIHCVMVEYTDYPAVEWTVYFKNTGTQDTPILENIQGLDTTFHRGSGSEFVLNGIKGDWCDAHSFEPYRTTLDPNLVKNFAPPGNSGKSCDGPDGWPYFNLQTPGGGVMLAVGWPGQWASTFARDAADGLHVTAGQQLTHLLLKPGETIRTPLIAMLFWKGADIVPAQNLWRRWMTAHNMPRTGGKTQPPTAQIQVSATDDNVKDVEAVLKAGMTPDICWRDAGGGFTWYVNSGSPFKGNDAWLNTGTWDIDPGHYPNGFKPFSDWVHAHGLQFLVWFEPERVGDPNSWLGKNHPEWLLPNDGTGSILNEGNPEAWNWLVDHIDTIIKTQGLDWYREDMNGPGPLAGWRKHDTADRQGMTENLYVQGHLAYWDELRRRNPGLRIDSCASGGRRDDLETLRRAVPLLRSDFQFPNQQGVVEGNQGQTYGLSSWLPFYGTGCYFTDPYSSRSFYMAGFGTTDKKAFAEWRRVSLFFLGDYYPLTPYSLAADQWIAWQFNRPESGDGMIQAFRHASNQTASQTFHLAGLDPQAQYEVTNLDVAGSAHFSGQELINHGVAVEIKDLPGSAIVVYRKAN
jgi:alpha-galactosidase